MTAPLFHGPEARATALREANRLGRLIKDPIGDTGLKVDQAREVVSLMMSTPLGTKKGTLVIGPLDFRHDNSDKARDILLKSIEEHPSNVVLPLLWAHDLEEVSPTIRSRCDEKWCPPEGEVEFSEQVEEKANRVWELWSKGDKAAIPAVLSDVKEVRDLVTALAVICREEKDWDLWSRVRDVACLGKDFHVDLLSASLIRP